MRKLVTLLTIIILASCQSEQIETEKTEYELMVEYFQENDVEIHTVSITEKGRERIVAINNHPMRLGEVWCHNSDYSLAASALPDGTYNLWQEDQNGNLYVVSNVSTQFEAYQHCNQQ